MELQDQHPVDTLLVEEVVEAGSVGDCLDWVDLVEAEMEQVVRHQLRLMEHQEPQIPEEEVVVG
jgi:hypothetical protein